MAKMKEATTSRCSEISLDDIRGIAQLACLGLIVEEELRMQRDLGLILEYVAQLEEVDTSSVEPMSQAQFMLEDHSVHRSQDTLRPDIVQPSLDRSEVMAQAPETDGRFFKVPRVLER